MGQGCSLVKDWSGLQVWLENHRAVLKRADVAYDDHDGKLVSIEWAVRQYKDGGFNAGGRKPRSESPRLLRRLIHLRGLSHEQVEQVLAGGA